MTFKPAHAKRFPFLGNVGKRPWSFFRRWACVGGVARSLVNVAKRSSKGKILSMHKIFSRSNVRQRLRTFAKRYAYGMKSFSSLDYRSACV